MSRKKTVAASGFKLPAANRQPLAADAIEAFARGSESRNPQARELAQSRAHEPAQSQARNTASSQDRAPAQPPPQPPPASEARARSTANSHDVQLVRPRSGTGDNPYVRRDGTATRSTTVHLELDLHRRVRLRALEQNRSMSEIIAEAVSSYLG